jgi:AcrR family transcriptional regulator
VTTPTQNLQREARILDAAAALIAHYGYDKTTMDDIAREAGVSKGALYLHFKSKDALVETLILRESERVGEGLLARVMADPNGGSLFKIYSYSLQAVAENPLLRALYVNDRRVLGDMVRRLREMPMYQQGFSFAQTFVEQMQTAGLIRKDIPANLVTYMLAAIRFGVLTMDESIQIDNPPSIDAVGELVATMLDKTFAPEGGDSEAGKAAFARLIEYGRAVIEARRKERGEKE